jgi:hypothetical protein
MTTQNQKKHFKQLQILLLSGVCNGNDSRSTIDGINKGGCSSKRGGT